MALILSIETATTNCSVAVSKSGQTIALKEDNNANYSHAESLHVFIDDVLQMAKVSKEEIDAIAVSKGPGSYTGLRIGVSAAKGLCFALGLPLISISTLKSLALQVKTSSGLIIPLLDARRMEVYAATFDSSYELIKPVHAEILEENSFEGFLKEGEVIFIGNAAGKSSSVITHPNASFINDRFPSANEMSALAYEKYKKSDIEDVAYFEPFYLKDFIAIKPKKV